MNLKNLSTALMLLNYFTPETPDWGVRALAKASKQPLAVVQRILATYASNGFLERTGEINVRYQLGMRFYELGCQVGVRFKFSDLINPALKFLAEETGETVSLIWLNQNTCTCIAVQNSPNSIHLSIKNGSKMPLHAGAGAKVILANFEEDDLECWLQSTDLKKYTDETETNKEALRVACSKIKQQGFCYSGGELIADSFGLAVPIFIQEHTLFGSLALSGPRYRFQEENISEFVIKLNDVVRIIKPALSHLS